MPHQALGGPQIELRVERQSCAFLRNLAVAASLRLLQRLCVQPAYGDSPKDGDANRRDQPITCFVRAGVRFTAQPLRLSKLPDKKMIGTVFGVAHMHKNGRHIDGQSTQFWRTFVA
jgi:hypothetical protein